MKESHEFNGLSTKECKECEKERKKAKYIKPCPTCDYIPYVLALAIKVRCEQKHSFDYWVGGQSVKIVMEQFNFENNPEGLKQLTKTSAIMVLEAYDAIAGFDEWDTQIIVKPKKCPECTFKETSFQTMVCIMQMMLNVTGFDLREYAKKNYVDYDGFCTAWNEFQDKRGNCYPW